MIRNIKVRNTATFNNSGIEIPEFKKINFIYGSNGSGKTTLSNFLYNPRGQKFTDCSLQWLNDFELKTLVYNKDFRDRNFGNGAIPGVFTLGEATKDETEAIDEKINDLTSLKEDGVKKSNVLDIQVEEEKKTTEEFKEKIWLEVYKKYEHCFKEAFKGVMQKKMFSEKLVYEFKNNTSELNKLEHLKEKALIIFGDAPQRMFEIKNILFNTLNEIESEPIWQKKILGKADVEIGKLIQALNANDWVHEGTKFIDHTDVCPFCQEETITPDFKQELENYFDKSFTHDTESIRNFGFEYLRVFQNIINEFNQIEINEKANELSKLDLEKFESLLQTLNSIFISNRELLNSKLKEPSRSIELISSEKQLGELEKLIISANDAIREHNIIVDNFSSEHHKLVSNIWKFIIEDNRLTIEMFLKKQEGMKTGIKILTNQVQELRDKYKNLGFEIKELTKNLTSVQPSVDEINRTLDSFGFQNFKIHSAKTGKNQYQILRENGDLAESTLSEGEITFITFLYFLQLVKGGTTESDVNDERVIIIDDPISSLDSNILFVVSSLLKQITKKIKRDEGIIKQLILLTHNVYFHKEVSFIDGRNQRCNKTNYWILRKMENNSQIQDFESVNPIQNSYELLWKELCNSENNSGITIQNTMRRIIENYFKILGKYGDDDLINSFSNAQDKEICRSLICWINDGSHTIPDDLFVEQQTNTIDSYFRVFENIFIETKHHEHFKMMMGQ